MELGNRGTHLDERSHTQRFDESFGRHHPTGLGAQNAEQPALPVTQSPVVGFGPWRRIATAPSTWISTATARISGPPRPLVAGEPGQKCHGTARTLRTGGGRRPDSARMIDQHDAVASPLRAIADSVARCVAPGPCSLPESGAGGRCGCSRRREPSRCCTRGRPDRGGFDPARVQPSSMGSRASDGTSVRGRR